MTTHLMGLCAASIAILTIASGRTEGLSNILFMADIGHSREHKDVLRQSWITGMGRNAEEGAFSLYEGLHEFISKQDIRPTAVVVAGDVAYTGGDYDGLEGLQKDFQKYLNHTVPLDRVFPLIGNHDVHFLGCLGHDEFLTKDHSCHYGTNADWKWVSKPGLSFDQWRANWLDVFPGLRSLAILPPSPASPIKPSEWMAPQRYNLNLDDSSSVYIIAGLASGVLETDWVGPNGETPLVAIDAMSPKANGVECDFLRDSLAHGHSLGKSVFVYFTHNFDRVCDDWSLMQQIDVWITGHKHNAWQNADTKSLIVQESRHYPTWLLLGNGGFDEADIDVVSFGHFWEEVSSDDRILVHFDVYDTCISNENRCPSGIYNHHCWKKCKDIPGGFDGGGGPRKALPSKYDLGFTVSAPRKRSPLPKPAPKGPRGGSWKLRLGEEWLGLGGCGKQHPVTARCLLPMANESAAAVFTIFGAASVEAGTSETVSARLAVDDMVRGPVVESSGDLLRNYGFWDKDSRGLGRLSPSDAWRFEFAGSDETTWELRDVEWRVTDSRVGRSLAIAPSGAGSSLIVSFVQAEPGIHIEATEFV